ncbi:MAG: dihydrofolate reductase [Flavobacteriales bacterium]|nr:dihydrofolate reductase [Flavobacteriales bacterium]
MVSAIVAVGKNLEIGKGNDLLWHLPADMKYFKETTTGHHVITGRKSYESIPEKYRPLPNRVNIVVSRQSNLAMNGAVTVNSIDDAIAFARNANEVEAFIIGGGQIYADAMAKDIIDKLYITGVDGVFEADTYFPNVDLSLWKETSSRQHIKDDKNQFDMTFSIYEKK